MDMHFLAAPRQDVNDVRRAGVLQSAVLAALPSLLWWLLSQPGGKNRGLSSASPSGESLELGQEAGPGLHSSSCEPSAWAPAGSAKALSQYRGQKRREIPGLFLRHIIKSWACSPSDNLLLVKIGLLGSIIKIRLINNVGKSSH